ncbi:MAG: patatin-like phospholipase family protein [Myxococcota bacterium]
MEFEYRLLLLTDVENIEKVLASFKPLNLTQTSDNKIYNVTSNQSNFAFQLHLSYSIKDCLKKIKKFIYHSFLIDGNAKKISPLKFIEIYNKSHYSNRILSISKILVIFPLSPPSSRLLLELGKKQIGDVWVKGQDHPLIQHIQNIIIRSKPGKTALCLAGGGIEGLIYELGVLSYLNDIMVNKTVKDFDIFTGISAGSIISSALVNGIPTEEITRAFFADSSLFKPIRPYKLFDLSLKEITSRFLNIALNKNKNKFNLESLTSLIPNAAFKGDIIEDVIQDFLSSPGHTGDFKKLEKELYIGATDQDTYEHIIFGSKGWQDVPIHRAVHASMSLIPFYEPQWINGRWFIDGSFTKTSEIDIAIEKGATLVVIVDPLVPVKTSQTGYVREKGGIFAGIQGLKALINTRFKEVLPHLIESNPKVDFVVFVPGKEDMSKMSGIMFRYRYRLEIVRITRETAMATFKEKGLRVKDAFKRHGIELSVHNT